MAKNTKADPSLFALLIGIDHYLSHSLPGGGYYPKLQGCVPDVERVETFLKAHLGLQDNQIIKLTATFSTEDEPPEPEERWPTRKNMVAAFKQIGDMAGEGDLVYIHYSGHGGRSPTIYPKLKGESAKDESLVPMDIGRKDGQYLRDIELAYLFQEMVDKGIVLSVVFDSCHSGGTTRAVDIAVRGIEQVDTTLRPPDDLVASEAELAATWMRVTGGQTRALKPGGGWLPQPNGYTLLAACRPQESAFEYAVEPGQRGGAFTYWLLDSLGQLRPGFSYRMLHNQVLPRVHALFPQQTPQLQGIGDRVVFGSENVQAVQAVNVNQVDLSQDRVQLSAGQAQMVRPGAQFAVYPPGTVDLAQQNRRRALVTVKELGATTSWAEITKRFDGEPIAQGDQAILVDPGSARLQRLVRLVPHEPDAAFAQADQNTALAQLERALDVAGGGWVMLAGKDDSADYRVLVNAVGEYQITDPAGQPIPNLHPPLKVDDQHAAEHVVKRLVHMTKYHNIVLLDNHDRTSPLAGALEVEVLRAQPNFVPGDPPEPQPFADAGHTPTASTGDWLVARIRNRASRVINIAALNLSSDWGISQVHPTWTSYVSLDPGAEELFPLRAELPEGCREGTEVLKVFATLEPVDFGWLALPVLDQPQVARGTRAATGLNGLWAALTADKPRTRKLHPAEYPSQGWTTAQVEIRIGRM